MPYLAPGDPNPRKTKAELAEEETFGSELEETSERHPAVGWLFTIAGLVVLAGMLAKACLT